MFANLINLRYYLLSSMARQSPDTSPPPRPMTPLACDLKLVDTAHDDASISGRMESDHLSGQKRKAGPGELATKSSNKFKVLGQLVLAMKRFQGAARVCN